MDETSPRTSMTLLTESMNLVVETLRQADPEKSVTEAAEDWVVQAWRDRISKRMSVGVSVEERTILEERRK